MNELVDKLCRGDRRALARAMSRVDSTGCTEASLEVSLRQSTGQVPWWGFTGPPGVGKSTLIDALLVRLRQQGRRIGVLAVDPSSPRSNGAVLGDRVRMMQHAVDDDVFIRSLATHRHQGGLSDATLHCARLLELADRFYQETRGPDNEWLDVHNVNFTLQFRYPGVYYQQSGEKRHLEESAYWYNQHMSTWGQQAGGAFGGDELVRSGYQDPRQGIETCGIVEFANSFNMLGSISGDPIYADRCEEIMFNHFPASLTPEYRGVRYVNASNQPILNGTFNHHYRNDMSRTQKNKLDAVPFVVYTPWGHRCCQHNSGMGWPYFAENLCLRTADGGIATWLYSSATVTTEAGGREVTITEETSYPFAGKVTLTVDCDGAVDFPLYMRVPGWCPDYTLQINDEPLFESDGSTCGFLMCRRSWKSGDRITLDMAMPCRVRRWPRNGSATILRGPLAFSVKIEEHWQRWVGEDENQNYDFRGTYCVYEEMVKGTDEWPNYEVLPTSPWNYALILSEDAKESCKVIVADEIPDQPWTPDTVPLAITVMARRLPEWRMEGECTPEVTKSPVFSAEADEEITLIPLGAARLRMACLPVVGNG